MSSVPTPASPSEAVQVSAPAQPVRIPLPLYRPLWTYMLLALSTLVWLAMTAAGGSENPLVLIQFGAKYNPLIVAGQYWRLLTACFVHVGLTHLLFNAYALFSFGIEIERRYGRGRFLALYLLAGLAGSVLSFIGSDAVSAGASGAIFGLVGANIAYFATYRDEFGQSGRRQLTSVLVVAGYNLLLGFIAPGIDNLGHIGGLVAGLALGWAYCPRYRLAHAPSGEEPYKIVDRFPRARAWLFSLGVALLLIVLVSLGVRLQST